MITGGTISGGFYTSSSAEADQIEKGFLKSLCSNSTYGGKAPGVICGFLFIIFQSGKLRRNPSVTVTIKSTVAGKQRFWRRNFLIAGTTHCNYC